MIIEKIGSDKKLEKIIEEDQERYEERNGVACNYTPFSFCAKENDEIIGAVIHGGGAVFKNQVSDVNRERGSDSLFL